MRTPLLLEAHDAITGERAKSYGDAKQGFAFIAAQWNLYLIQKYKMEPVLTAEDICWMMADLKKVRQLTNSKRDNVLDAVAYIALIEQCGNL